jgi:hypothetical protein
MWNRTGCNSFYEITNDILCQIKKMEKQLMGMTDHKYEGGTCNEGRSTFCGRSQRSTFRRHGCYMDSATSKNKKGPWTYYKLKLLLHKRMMMTKIYILINSIMNTNNSRSYLLAYYEATNPKCSIFFKWYHCTFLTERGQPDQFVRFVM